MTHSLPASSMTTETLFASCASACSLPALCSFKLSFDFSQDLTSAFVPIFCWVTYIFAGFAQNHMNPA